jgi:hypothetical protein
MLVLVFFVLRELEHEFSANGSLMLECCDEFFIAQEEAKNKHILFCKAQPLTRAPV